MIRISRRNTPHDFVKQNLVTVMSRKGSYDLYKCTACGLTGKAYGLGEEITIEERYASKAAVCPKAPVIRKIRITECHAAGKAFANLMPGSEHEVIPTPPQHAKSTLPGVWVMGVGEPVKVLHGEFEEVNP